MKRDDTNWFKNAAKRKLEWEETKIVEIPREFFMTSPKGRCKSFDWPDGPGRTRESYETLTDKKLRHIFLLRGT